MAENKKMEELSYEELKNVAVQLQMQNVKMREVITQLSGAVNAQQRIEYLLKVINVAHMFKPEFIQKCVEEVEQLMTLPEKEETEEAAPKAE